VARAAFDWLIHIGLGPALRVGVVAAVVAIPVGLALWLALVARVRRAADYAAIAALAAAYGVALLTLADMPIERVHLLEYGAVGLLAFRALRHRFGGTDRAILAALVALNIGLGDELIQGLLPRRFYDTKDVMANALAGLLAVLAAAVVSRESKGPSVNSTGFQDAQDRQDSGKSIL
jgi:VanZ family protein